MLTIWLTAQILLLSRAEDVYTSVAPIVQSPLDPEGVCRSSHRCNGLAEVDTTVLSCHCDRNCRYFRDCCPEAPTSPSQRNINDPQYDDFECTEENVLMVVRCPLTENRVSELCHGRSSNNDPYLQVPVTDTSRNYTYWNYYCALCHGVKIEEMVFWDVEVNCNGVIGNIGNESSFTEQLIFNKDVNSWGFWIYTDRLHFESCKLIPKQPPRLKALYSPRSCYRNIIDFCPESWSGTKIDEWCEDFYAPVFKDGTYKNAYCAICHGERLEDLACSPRKVEYGVKSVSLPSFAILLDMNPDASRRVGKILTCEEGQVTFAGECRALTCGLPGYVVRDGKCVKKHHLLD